MCIRDRLGIVEKYQGPSTIQIILSTHSPFMLGTLNAKIYNLDTEEYDIAKWSDLDNVRYFYNFFKKHEDEFKENHL